MVALKSAQLNRLGRYYAAAYRGYGYIRQLVTVVEQDQLEDRLDRHTEAVHADWERTACLEMDEVA